MKTKFQIIPWLILLIPFVGLIYFYNSLPQEVLIARSFLGTESIFAPKSFFTVFRVPLIELACAAAIEVMRRKFASTKADYYLMWSVLLYTVAFKSLFQAFEIVTTNSVFYYVTLTVVIVGIGAAIFKGRKFFLRFSRDDWNLGGAEKAILAFILVAYLGLAIVPIYLFK